MQLYESDDNLTKEQVAKFTSWLHDNIGTEYEVNQVSRDEYYIMVYDLTYSEVVKITKFEMECCNNGNI